MSAHIDCERRAKLLADLQEEINDKDALLKDPESHTRNLSERAKAAHTQSIISSEDLSELLEWIDSGYEWAVEELVDRSKNTV